MNVKFAGIVCLLSFWHSIVIAAPLLTKSVSNPKESYGDWYSELVLNPKTQKLEQNSGLYISISPDRFIIYSDLTLTKFESKVSGDQISVLPANGEAKIQTNEYDHFGQSIPGVFKVESVYYNGPAIEKDVDFLKKKKRKPRRISLVRNEVAVIVMSEVRPNVIHLGPEPEREVWFSKHPTLGSVRHYLKDLHVFEGFILLAGHVALGFFILMRPGCVSLCFVLLLICSLITWCVLARDTFAIALGINICLIPVLWLSAMLGLKNKG